MALDPIVNFGKVTASTGYISTDTVIVLNSGDGAKLPATSTIPNPDFGYNMVWWNWTDFGDPSDDPNVEIIRVTARSTDTLTIVRGQEGTTAQDHNTAGKTYKLALTFTKLMKDQIENNFYETPYETSFLTFKDFSGSRLEDSFYQSGDGAIMPTGDNSSTADFSTGNFYTSYVNLYVSNVLAGPNGLDLGQALSATIPHRFKAYATPTKTGTPLTQKTLTIGMNILDANVILNFFNHGCFFRVDSTSSGVNIFAVTKNGGGDFNEQTTDTGIADTAGVGHTFEIIATSAQALFYIDGVLVATHTTHLPTRTITAFLTIGSKDANVKVMQVQWLKFSRPR